MGKPEHGMASRNGLLGPKATTGGPDCSKNGCVCLQVRCLCTYLGEGTLFVENNHVDRQHLQLWLGQVGDSATASTAHCSGLGAETLQSAVSPPSLQHGHPSFDFAVAVKGDPAILESCSITPAGSFIMTMVLLRYCTYPAQSICPTLHLAEGLRHQLCCCYAFSS